MAVETWDDFTTTLSKALPVLSPNNKRKIKDIIKWSHTAKRLGKDPKKDEVEWIRNQLVKVIGSSTGQVRKDISSAWGFLGWMLRPREMKQWKTLLGCRFWGGYWWGNACHDEPWKDRADSYISPNPCTAAGYYWWLAECHTWKPACETFEYRFDCNINGCYYWDRKCHSQPEPPEQPPPPPEPPQPCSRITSQSECLARSCYWYGGRCHNSPKPAPTPSKRPFAQLADDAEKFCKTIPIWDIPKLIVCNMFKDILRMLDDFLDFSK